MLLVGAVLGVIGLAVGLGVGLTVGRRKQETGNTTSENSTIPQSSENSRPIQQFPLGQYSFVTTLRAQQTECTSNPATWRCYPYAIFDSSDPSTSASSQSTFDWIIRNTSDVYASNVTSPTSPEGISANLTISSTNNPFAITFTPQALSFYSSNSNATSSRLTFELTLPKVVVPTSAITPNNAVTQCFFNSTTLSGSIYLSAERDSVASSGNIGSYEKWPYAVEIVQSSPSGQNTPECYEMVNGGLGERVQDGLDPVAEGGECRCEYRNY